MSELAKPIEGMPGTKSRFSAGQMAAQALALRRRTTRMALGSYEQPVTYTVLRGPGPSDELPQYKARLPKRLILPGLSVE